jgi:hypothetical protein
MNPMKWVTSLDIDWRSARFVAIGYLALSAFNFAFAHPIAYASLGALGFLAFFSGPAGFPFAFVTLSDSWTMTIVVSYLVATCLLAPFLALSCHRKIRVSTPSRIVATLLWLVAGLFAVSYTFAYAA